MCDCYGHPCAVPECEEYIDMHLEDFETPREDILVYCDKHIDVAEGGIVWEWNDDDEIDDPAKVKEWFKCRVIPLTPVAREHALENCPNTWHCRIVEE